MGRRVRSRRFLLLLGGLFAAIGITAYRAPWHSAGDRASEAAERLHAEMASSELVRRLLDPASRPFAYYELCRRESREKPRDFETFQARHRDPEVVVCSQGAGKQPVSVVLSDFLSHIHEGSGFGLARPQELFERPLEDQKRSKLLIEVFTAEGKMINPFENNNNVLEGVIADVNGDGLIERVDHLPVGGGDMEHADVLFVEILGEKAEPILTVVYNWGSVEDWDFEISDHDGDGLREIELGPQTYDGFKARVTWRWSRELGKYMGPDQTGSHYRVIDPTKLWPELARLEKEGTRFEKDPEGISGRDRESLRRGGSRPAASRFPPSGPYRYESLRHLSHDEILRYMAEPEPRDLPEVQKTTMPDRFWDLPSREAAQAFVQANRSEQHKQRFQFGFDDRDGAMPPERCAISLSYTSAPCYGTVNAHHHLLVDPAGSYLITAESKEPSALGWLLDAEKGRYGFRICEVSYAEARKVSDVIWWLRRGRTWPPGESFGMALSSADGHATLQLIGGDGRRQIVATGTSRAGTVPERWNGMYGEEDFLQCAEFVVTAGIAERLGARWPVAASAEDTEKVQSVPYGDPEDFVKQRALVGRLLAMFTADQLRISYPLASEAARAAGDWWLHECEPDIRRIGHLLDDIPALSEKQTQAEIDMLRAQAEREMSQSRSTGRALVRLSRWIHDRVAKLFRGETDVNHGLDLAAARTSLKKAVSRSLKELSSVPSDPLPALARDRSQAACWALWEMSKTDEAAYMSALEFWVENGVGTERERAIATIAERDPTRARDLRQRYTLVIARETHPDEYAVVHEAEAMLEEAKRVETLLRIASDNDEYDYIRAVAVDALVPPDDPWRYRDGSIDSTLLKLADIRRASLLTRKTAATSGRALAQRTGCSHFDAALSDFDPGDFMGGREGLGIVTNMAMAGGPDCHVRMLAYLRPHFEQSNLSAEDVLWSAWCADLRELKPEIERLATSGPGVREGDLTSTWSSSPHQMEGRYHLARRIAALWNEEDPVTRAKLVIAFGFGDGIAHAGLGGYPERRWRLIESLREESRVLTPEQKAEAFAFRDFCMREGLGAYSEAPEIIGKALGVELEANSSEDRTEKD